MVVMMFMCGSFTALIVSTVIRYLSYDVTTTILVREEKPMPFPSVTICNNNIYRKSVLMQHSDVAKHVYDTSSFRMGPLRLNNSEFFSDVSKLDFEQLILNLSHRRQDMIMNCFFNVVNVSCDEYLTRTTTFAGYCYTFNSEKIIEARGRDLYVDRAGKDYAMRLWINVEQYEYYFGNYGGSAGIDVR